MDVVDVTELYFAVSVVAGILAASALGSVCLGSQERPSIVDLKLLAEALRVALRNS